MKQYKWDKKQGVIDAETGQQVLKLSSINCTNKFRNKVGRVLVEKLNQIELMDKLRREYNKRREAK